MKGNNPKVSVIIPTYNRAHLIGRAIKSVLEQTYQDFEIIVVDDGSTDNTDEVVRDFGDERIRYIRHEKNKGGATARNTGIKAAKGEFIAFQDSDDEWLPEKLDKQMQVFENVPAKVGVVYTGFWRIKGGKKTYRPSAKIIRKEGDIHNELLKGNFATTQTTVVRKECFEKAEMFDERLLRLQDWELFIRISKFYEFKCVDEPLVVSYFTPDSISANYDALIKAHKLILEKHFEDIKKDKKTLANHHLGIGTSLCMNKEIGEGESYFAKAFKIYPDINKDRKLLSKHYFDIGITLCSNDGDFKNGRCYFIKAVKAYPFNIKSLLIVFLSSFGQGVYNEFVENYQKIRSAVRYSVNKWLRKSP